MKTCPSCKESLPESAYWKSKKEYDGLQSHCKKCRMKKYYGKYIGGPIPEYKYCPDCKETKPSAGFYRNKWGHDSLQTLCKKCMDLRKEKWDENRPEYTKEYGRAYHRRMYPAVREAALDRSLRNRRGVPSGTYTRMLKQQEGVCAICCNPPKNTRLYLDHCHITGVIRQLLCAECNWAIGCVDERITVLERALSYLTAVPPIVNIDFKCSATKEARHMRKKYGLSKESFLGLVKAQGGVCPVCGMAPSSTDNFGTGLVVDHCHKTNVIRGALCERCNWMVGKFKDDPLNIQRAMDYLYKWHSFALTGSIPATEP